MRFNFRKRHLIAVLALVLILVSFGVITIPKVPPAFYSPEASELPLLALFSLSRVVVALFVGVVFAFVFGYLAATTKLRSVLLPMLEVQQDVPAIGFFPAAVLVLINFFQCSFLGLELACILLIFSCIAWNITFSVYESIITLPKELLHAANSFGLNSWLKFKNVLLPAAIPHAVYNSMMSWTNAWFFLIACEIISLSGQTYRLRGIGNFLMTTAAEGRIELTFVGLAVLVALLLVVDVLVWRPLQVWAARFRYDIVSPTLPQSRVYRMWRWLPRLVWFSGAAILLLKELLDFLHHAIIRPTEKAWAWLKQKTWGKAVDWIASRLIVGVLLLFGGAWFFILYAFIGFNAVTQPIPPEAYSIPAALLSSSLRVTAAFLLSLAWTLPFAVWLAGSPRARRYLIPLCEVTASVPATALFPVIVLVVIGLVSGLGGINFAAILLVMTGMQWYLFFNIFAGLTSIPEDLLQAARSFGVKGFLYWKRVLLPAITPSLVTGSVTAIGGGWNTLIVAEYFVYGGQTFAVTSGIGKMIVEAAYVTGSMNALFWALTALVVTVVALNTLVWKRLYDYAARKYSFEYAK